jgi:hypothetical protein
VYIVWGSTFLGLEEAGRTLPAFLMLAARFAIAESIRRKILLPKAESPRIRRNTRHSVRPSEYFVQVESGCPLTPCASSVAAADATAAAERSSSAFIVSP